MKLHTHGTKVTGTFVLGERKFPLGKFLTWAEPEPKNGSFPSILHTAYRKVLLQTNDTTESRAL